MPRLQRGQGRSAIDLEQPSLAGRQAGGQCSGCGRLGPAWGAPGRPARSAGGSQAGGSNARGAPGPAGSCGCPRCLGAAGTGRLSLRARRLPGSWSLLLAAASQAHGLPCVWPVWGAQSSGSARQLGLLRVARWLNQRGRSLRASLDCLLATCTLPGALPTAQQRCGPAPADAWPPRQPWRCPLWTAAAC